MNIKTWQERMGKSGPPITSMQAEIEELRAALASFIYAGTASGMPRTNDGFTMTAFDGNKVPPGTKVYIRKD